MLSEVPAPLRSDGILFNPPNLEEANSVLLATFLRPIVSHLREAYETRPDQMINSQTSSFQFSPNAQCHVLPLNYRAFLNNGTIIILGHPT